VYVYIYIYIYIYILYRPSNYKPVIDIRNVSNCMRVVIHYLSVSCRPQRWADRCLTHNRDAAYSESVWKRVFLRMWIRARVCMYVCKLVFPVCTFARTYVRVDVKSSLPFFCTLSQSNLPNLKAHTKKLCHQKVFRLIKDGHLPRNEGRKRDQFQWICTGFVAPRGQRLGELQRRTAY